MTSPDPARPSHAHLRCRKCREWKLRRFFVPHNAGERTKYDIYCSTCRDIALNDKATKIDLVVLHNRVKNGLTTPEKQAEILKKKQEAKNNAVVKSRKTAIANRNFATWVQPHASAHKTLRLLRNHDYPDEDCKQWGLKAEDMVNEAIAEIKERKRLVQLPDSQVMLWYDVVPGMGHRAREHIDNYPLGADKAPIQCM